MLVSLKDGVCDKYEMESNFVGIGELVGIEASNKQKPMHLVL